MVWRSPTDEIHMATMTENGSSPTHQQDRLKNCSELVNKDWGDNIENNEHINAFHPSNFKKLSQSFANPTDFSFPPFETSTVQTRVFC